MQKVLYGCKTISEETISESDVGIGNFVSLSFPSIESAEEFLSGFRSGIARIAKSSYVLPKVSSFTPPWYIRGFRFAWIAHHYGKAFANDEFPEGYRWGKSVQSTSEQPDETH